jgi:hypothetical protein
MTQSDFLVAADLLESHGSPLAEMMRQVAAAFPESTSIADGGRWRVQCNAGILYRNTSGRDAQPKPSRLRVCHIFELDVNAELRRYGRADKPTTSPAPARPIASSPAAAIASAKPARRPTGIS